MNVHPILCMVLGYAHIWAFNNDLPFVVTSAVSDIEKDRRLGRVSSSHRDRRAVDLSIKGWTTDNLDDFKIDVESRFGQYGAISYSDHEKRLVVVKSDHIHLQISPEMASHKNEKLLYSLCSFK